MSPLRRIVFNIVATYGRSLYALLLGIFTARWALNALGHVDYGLIGTIGGLAMLVSFINSLLSFSVSRFYGVSAGSELRSGNYEEGLEECRKWFNTALVMHTILPILLMLVGYPIGAWAVRNFLTIPPDRVEPCVWVWRFTCVTCFVSMISIPFNAMYNAKQDIAELTVYDFVTSTINAYFLYYMVTHPKFWIVKYALWTCVIQSVPTIIKMLRAVFKYPECRCNAKYLCDVDRIVEIFSFSMARLWTGLSSIISNQGNSILVNKYLGPAFNASLALGNTVVSKASTLSAALTGAFSPAIMNAAGAGDVALVRELSFRQCRFGTVLVLLFALPLALEIREVLVLWLKAPPPYVSELVLAILFDVVFERMSEGLYMPIMAFGKGVAQYSWAAGWCGMARFAIAWLLLAMGLGLYGICLALVIARILIVFMRLHMGAKLAAMSAGYWVKTVFVPLAIVCSLSLSAGSIVLLFRASFVRVIITMVTCEAIFLPGMWLLVMTKEERAIVLTKVRQYVR